MTLRFVVGLTVLIAMLSLDSIAATDRDNLPQTTLIPPAQTDLTNGHLTALQRLEEERLKAAHEDRLRFGRERRDVPAFGMFEHDYRAVIHVHAEDSDHTKGTRQEVLAAAKKTGVQVVMFSDHRGPKPETWQGLREGVLFIAGSEDGDGVLRFPSLVPKDSKRLTESSSRSGKGTEPQGGEELRFLSHVEERYDTPFDPFVGMEICNRHTDAKLDRSVEQLLASMVGNPQKSSPPVLSSPQTAPSPQPSPPVGQRENRQTGSWKKFVDNFKTFPDEVFAAGTDYHPQIFSVWDRATLKRHFTGIGANDAHQNQIFAGVTFDPYEVSFRNLCTHILANELTEGEIRQALREGHAYVSHDWLCDATGFGFAAQNNLGVFPMGDTGLMWGTTRVIGLTPLAAKLKLIHNGKVIYQTNGTNLTFVAKSAGTYRLEAWLSVAGEDRPWIYSNPVYLEQPSLTSIPIPSVDFSAPVDVKKDIVYTEGKPEHEKKHQLDLYLPRAKTGAPVFLFFHGGAWKSGDRSQYPALGYRFAREGIVTVIPSYRLAPKNKHPAQMEDGAAAFAWVAEHIGKYGGDTNRIYVGGHSAGGHMAALLALDDQYLKAHRLAPNKIRGVVTMSGAFDLTGSDSVAAGVFSSDHAARQAASPLFYVAKGVAGPPFLITYCQWDYVPLGGQARHFYRALRNAGIAAEIRFVPHENHISEVIALTHDGDPTAKTLVRFIH